MMISGLICFMLSFILVSSCPTGFWGSTCSNACPSSCPAGSQPQCDQTTGLCNYPECLDPTGALGCDWYPDCLESLFQCGPSGYPLGYGYKYCSAFMVPQNYDKFDAAGQEFVNQTMICLEKAAVAAVEADPGMNCTQLNNACFSSHPKCYASSGVCTIPEDWWQIFSVIKSSFITEFKETMVQVAQTMALCGKQYATSIVQQLSVVVSTHQNSSYYTPHVLDKLSSDLPQTSSGSSMKKRVNFVSASPYTPPSNGTRTSSGMNYIELIAYVLPGKTNLSHLSNKPDWISTANLTSSLVTLWNQAGNTLGGAWVNGASICDPKLNFNCTTVITQPATPPKKK